MNNDKNNIVLYTVPDLCKILDMTPQSIRKYLNTGKIKGIKAGGKWLVSEEALKEFLRGN